MGLARVKTWNPGDTLTAADLNAEFNNILNNPISLVSPTTGAINFQTSVAHTNLIPTALTVSSGSTGAILTVSTAGSAVWTTSGLSLPSLFQSQALSTSNFTTTSTAFITISGLSLTWTPTAPRRARVAFSGTILTSASGARTAVTLALDTVNLGSTDLGLVNVNSTIDARMGASFTFLTSVLSTASHTAAVQAMSAVAGTNFNLQSAESYGVLNVIEVTSS